MAPAATVTAADADLLGDFLAGDRSAFAEIVRRHAGLVHSAASRRAGEAAEDVTQAVFLTLLRKPGQARRAARRPGGLAAWLLATARNLSNNAERGRRRRDHHERRAAVRHDTTIGGDPAEALLWREIAPLLDDAVLSLPAGDRAAILMKFYEDRPATEIAAALGCSHDAARQRVARGLKRLRRRLNARGVTVPSATLAALLAARAVRSAPHDLTAACASLAAGGTATVAALALVQGTTTMTTALILKLSAAATLAAVGTGLALSGAAAQQQAAQSQPATQPPDEAAGNVAVGEVIERTLRDDADGTQLIDLDTGRVYADDPSLPDSVDAGPLLDGETVGLRGLRMTVQPVRNDLFDADPPPAQLVADLWRRELTANPYLDALGGLPRTFAFRTRDGAGGLLQITGLGGGDRPESVDLRYKILTRGEPATSDADPDAPPPLAEAQEQRLLAFVGVLQAVAGHVIVDGGDWPEDLAGVRQVVGDDWPDRLPETLVYARPQRDPTAPVGILPVLFETTEFPEDDAGPERPVVIVGFDDFSARPVHDAAELDRLLKRAGLAAPAEDDRAALRQAHPDLAAEQAEAVERLRRHLVVYGGLAEMLGDPLPPDPTLARFYPEPTDWPDVLGDVRHDGYVPAERNYRPDRQAGFVFDGPLEGNLRTRTYQTLVFPDGIAGTGRIDTQSYTTIYAAGQMAGAIVTGSYTTLVVDGDLTGELATRSYTHTLVTGTLRGSLLQGGGGTSAHVEGGIDPESAVLRGGKVRLAGRTTKAEVERLDAEDVAFFLDDSDLPAGEHRVGKNNVIVGDAVARTRARHDQERAQDAGEMVE